MKELHDLTQAIMASSTPPEKDRRTQAEILIEIAAVAELFHTPEAEPYAQVPVGVHSEIWSLRSKGFRRWLTAEYYRGYEKPPRNQALQDAIGVLESRAHFDSPECALFVRIGEYDGRIYVDLADEQRRAVEISTDGWRVISDPPIRFRRTRGMKALPEPLIGGSIHVLRRFLNLGSDNNWTLCLAWLVTAYRPKGPYPILILQGEQGSAKSTTAKLLRRLIDPSVSLIRTPPKDDRDLLIAASNSRVIAYDNLSGIAPWLSDALCRVATGGGFSTRELYTDSEEVFFDAMRPVILNGIDHLAERADLADRAVILNLPPIEESVRKDELQLYAEFERDWPKILGALFSIVSGTLARLAHTRLERKPRMADFALWATAAEEPLGLEPGAFMQAYCGNRAEAVQETLEADPVGAAIIALMDGLEEQGKTAYWEGTCKELQKDLECSVDEGTRKSRSWPKSPQAISGRLRRLATFFRESGIHITPPSKAGKGRRVLTIARCRAENIATFATPATQAADHKAAQPFATKAQGGDLTEQVAQISAPTVASPPRLLPVNCLRGDEKQEPVAEVAKVAIIPAIDPNQHPNGTVTAKEADRCPRCGPVHWQRLGGALVCSNCGQEKAMQKAGECGEPIERFEV